MSAPTSSPRQPGEARDFVALLFPDPESWIDVRHIREGSVKREPCHGYAEAREAIKAGVTAQRNVYVGVATRRTGLRAAKAGGKASLRDVAALWCDVDHHEEGDRELLEAALESFPLPPSMRVWSGGGEHLYWLLAEPFALNTPEGIQRFENALKGLADYLHGDRAATDASRILRVPGTTNYPDTRKRALGRTVSECFVSHPDNGTRYAFEDFADFETRGEGLAGQGEPVEYERKPWGGELPKSVERALRRDEKLRARWEGNTDGLADPSASAVDMAVAERLAFAKIPPVEIEHALRYRRADAGVREKHSGYYTLTVARACGWAQESKREYARAQHEATEQSAESDATPPEPSALEDGTDDGNALRFLRLHGQDMRYVPEWGRWLGWDGKRYRRDTRDAHRTRERVRESMLSVLREAAETHDHDKRSALLRQANTVRSKSKMGAAQWVAEAHSRVWVEPRDLDRDPMLLNLENGTLDLRSGKLREHRRGDLLTALAPVTWSPNARCPRWLKFLEQVQPDEEVRTYLQQIAGYTLSGDCSEDATFIHYGRGANGKSTAIETLRAVLGSDYTVELASNALMRRKYDSTELERLFSPLPGKRMATSLEPEEGQRFHEAALKRLSSGEPVSGRFLFHEQFEFVPVCKVWITTNHKPTISGDDEGIWRRVHFVPWTVEISAGDRDPSLRRELFADEREGILRWAVEGCLAWQRGDLQPPKAVTDATSEYREEQDAVGAFIEECCNPGANEQCRASVLYRAYGWWSERNGENPVSQKKFGGRLTRRGYGSYKSNGVWRKGLDVRPEVREAAKT